jgi:hypothetical protein
MTSIPLPKVPAPLQHITPVNLIRGFLIAATLFLSLLSDSGAVTYTFTKIADSKGPLDGFHFYPAINNAGVVVFVADVDSGGSGIFVGNGGPITTIADTSGAFSSFGSSQAGRPSLNSSGDVAFRASNDSGTQGIYVGSGGAITTVADVTNGFTGSLVGKAVINDVGTIGFFAVRSNPFVGGLFTWNAGTSTRVTSWNLGKITDYYSIDDSGTIVFVINRSSPPWSVLTTVGGPTLVADSIGPIQYFHGPVLNSKAKHQRAQCAVGGNCARRSFSATARGVARRGSSAALRNSAGSPAAS